MADPPTEHLLRGHGRGANGAENYTQALASSNLDLSPLTTPSAQFLKDLTDLGNALSAGNPAQVQSLWATAQQDQPQTVAQAMQSALANAITDGSTDPWWMAQVVDAGSGLAAFAAVASHSEAAASADGASTIAVTDKGFNGDLQTLESLIWENNANVGDYLTSQGYSSGAVKAAVQNLDVTQTLDMLPGLADAISQRGGPSNYTGTISNTSSVTVTGRSSSQTTDAGSTSSNELFTSMADSFNWTLAIAVVEPSTHDATVVVTSDAVALASATTSSRQSSTAVASADTDALSQMNQTKNLVANTIGTDTTLSAYAYNTTSARYAVTSAGVSVYA